MDVVLTNLTKVGGTVDVNSRPGQETRIIVKLPLTLAIIPSILVAVNDERFAIPQINLVELVRISPGDVAQRVERLGSAAVMRLREELLPHSTRPSKPEETSPEKNREVLRQQLSAVFDAIAAKRNPAPIETAPAMPSAPLRMPTAQPKIIGIGTSTGGPQALGEILPRLPGNLSVPVVLVQHMPPLFTASLAETMAAKCAVKVVQADHGMVLQRGLSDAEVSKYFVKVGERFRVSDELRSICRFQTDNLLGTLPPFPGRCEIVLLRNVLIYFSEADRKRALERILKVMSPEGFLIVGAAEAILSTTDRLTREEFRGAVYYRLRA